MKDEYISRYLTDYVNEEMKLIDIKDVSEHEYSKGFKKRMRKMLWSERYFGSRLRLGYAVRRVAVFALIAVGFICVNNVSAKEFGFNPWNTVKSIIADNMMESKLYTMIKGDKDNKTVKAFKDVPKMVSSDYHETERSSDSKSIYVEWTDGSSTIQYNRVLIEAASAISTDLGYDSRDKIEICGYKGWIYTKGSEQWIIWDDTAYRYQIIATNVDDSRQLLTDMAEDIYKQNS